MGSLYLTDLANWLRDAGLNVTEYSGWQTRSRSSGGFDDWPLCVMWHHTASNPSSDGKPDCDYMCNGSPDRPIANLYIQRNGTVWVLAAGATNTNGKGNPIRFSRGTVPQDSMNTRALGVEMANNGVGELWPQAVIDSMFVVSNVCNRRFGNQPSDVSSHQFYAPTRKIDPATTNVQGPWKPLSCTSSGSWDRASIQNECVNRASDSIAPSPPIPDDEDEMLFDGFWQRDNDWVIFALYKDGTKKWANTNDGDFAACQALWAVRGYPNADTVNVQPDSMMFTAFGIVVGPMPNDGVIRDEWGNVC